MFQIGLEQGYSLVTLAAVAVGAVAITLWFYKRIAAEVSRWRWLVLVSLRILALILLLLLLFRPVITFTKETREKRGVIFLVDTSASMGTTDDTSGINRLERVRHKVNDWWKKLEEDFQLELVYFADRAVAVKDVAELAALKPGGEATSLTRGLQAAGQLLPRKSVEAVILLSDGIHNASGDPAQTARKLGLTVHPVGVGANRRSMPSYRDVQLTALECPPQLILNNKAKITANVESVGLAGRVVKVFLEEDGKVVSQTDLALTSAAEPQTVEFQFLPETKGRHTYVVRLPVLNDEAVPQNNQRSVLAQVIDSRIRILYLEGALRAEYGALVERFLSKDPDLEFLALVQTKRNVFLQRSNMQGLSLNAIPSDPAVYEKFNVFMLGDLDSGFLKQAQMEMLQKRVRDGAGLVMLGGYNSLGPGGYGGTVLESILPVKLGERNIGQVNEKFWPALTTEGRQHPIFANISHFFPGPTPMPGVKEEALPPLLGCVKTAGLQAGASLLASYNKGTDKPLPVLAVQPVGRGRSAVFTADTTRNWHQVPRGLDQESPFIRFWGQLVRWLANRMETLPGVESALARTDKAYYEPEAPITISALVRDKEGGADSKAKVWASIKLPGGKEETIALNPGTAGQFQGRFDPPASGTYEIVVMAQTRGKKIEAEKLTVEVGRHNLEFDRLDLDDRTLTKIAEATGGRYYHLSMADRLIDELNRQEQKRRIALEQPLYFPTLYWVLFVAFLGGEWVVRKRFHLR